MLSRAGRLAAILLAVAAMLAVPPLRVAACSCAAPDPIEAEARADLVVVGAVAAHRAGADATFGSTVEHLVAVEEVRKGPTMTSVIVASPGMNSSCGWSMDVDTRWLIYATRAEGSIYTTGMCEPNRLLSERADVPTDAVRWPDEIAAEPDVNSGIPEQMLVMAVVILGLAAFSAVAFLRRGPRPGT